MPAAVTTTIRKQLIIEDRMLLACPYCWTKEEIAKEYPQLAGYPVSNHVCDPHFEILLRKQLSQTSNRA
jgi:hypothetical protein